MTTTHAPGPDLDPENLKLAAEPLHRSRSANPLPIRLEFAVLAALIVTVVVVLVLINAQRNSSTSVAVSTATAVPAVPIGGDHALGEDITNATPRPARGAAVPVGGGDSVSIGGGAPSGARQATAGGIPTPDPDLQAQLAATERGGNSVSVPPIRTAALPPDRATPAPPSSYVPPPTGSAPAPVTIGAGPPDTSGSSTGNAQYATSGVAPAQQSAVVSGGVSARAPVAPTAPSDNGPVVRTSNPNDAIVAQRSNFASGSSNSRAYLNSRIVDPISEYEVFAGTPMNVQLDDRIDSSLPGDCYAHITRDVHASRPPYPVVIPAGTRVQGRYNASTVAGDHQLQVAWDVMKFADGRSFDLNGMPGAENSGASGLAASSVDDHKGRIFSTTLLTAVLEAGLAATQPATSALGAISAGSQAAGAVGSSIAQTGQQLVTQQVQRPPTLTVERGRAFVIRLRSTIVVAPAEGGAQ